MAFSWFRSKAPPVSVSGELLKTLSGVLAQRGHEAVLENDCLQHRASGFVFRPEIAGVQPIGDRGFHTVTTVKSSHPRLIPDGIFEYQHGTAANVGDSIRQGFEQWADLDLVPLLDALRAKPEGCTTLNMSLPAEGDRPARHRRVVLGPVMHFMTNPPNAATKAAAGKSAQDKAGQEHEFCPCCLFTRSARAFQDLVKANQLFGIRLFASRDVQGAPQADCRVNGQDWQVGAEALRQYVQTWPDAGYEYRKQYVVLQSLRPAAAAVKS